MEVLKPPGPMNFKANNAADTWDKWLAQFMNYFKAAELKKNDKDVQVAILLQLAGPASLAIQKTFKYSEVESPDDYKTVLQKFTAYCRPRKNTVYERYRFFKRDQEEGEPIDQWVIELRTPAAVCEFWEQEELMIRDKLVFGVRHERAKERLLREGEVTLQRALDISHAAEASRIQLEGMRGGKQVHAIRTKNTHQTQANTQAEESGVKASQASSDYAQQNKKDCAYWGKRHVPGPRKCPAYGKTCAKCGGRNHWASVCKGGGTRRVRLVDANQEDQEASGEEFLIIETIFIGELDGGENQAGRWQEIIGVGRELQAWYRGPGKCPTSSYVGDGCTRWQS